MRIPFPVEAATVLADDILFVLIIDSDIVQV